MEQRIIKRCIDIVCALILLVIASPFMLVTAIVIKLYDGGPVLYKQIRCTRGGKEFAILKFRSMRVDAEKDGVARLAARHDSRITPSGRFIRAVRIDELPQLINILKGEMSFIGPRPERPEIIAPVSYTHLDVYKRQGLAVLADAVRSHDARKIIEKPGKPAAQENNRKQYLHLKRKLLILCPGIFQALDAQRPFSQIKEKKAQAAEKQKKQAKSAHQKAGNLKKRAGRCV